MPPSNGVSMLQELIDLFLEAVPDRIAQIHQCSANPTQLSFHAHALKSMSLNLGAKYIVAVSRQLEEFGRIGNLATVPALLKDLDSAFLQTKNQLLPLRDG